MIIATTAIAATATPRVPSATAATTTVPAVAPTSGMRSNTPTRRPSAPTFRRQLDERVEPLATAELHEQREEGNEEDGAGRLHGRGDDAPGRPGRRGESTRVDGVTGVLDDVESSFEKAEMAVAAREVLRERRGVVDEL